MIYTSPLKQLVTALYSVAAGVFIGAVYTAIRIAAVMLYGPSGEEKRRAAVFITDFAADLIFSVICTIITVVFIYAANGGTIRFFMLLFAFAGAVSFCIFPGKRLIGASRALSLRIRAAFRAMRSRLAYSVLPLKKRIENKKILRRAERIIKRGQ